MMQPVGSLPPEIYWRRRLALVAVLVVLVVLTGWALFGGGGGNGSATADARGTGTTGKTAAAPADTTAPSSPGQQHHAARTNGKATSTGKATTGESTKTTSTDKGAGPLCRPADLIVAAQTGAKTYPVNAQPALYLQVTNNGTKPCRQALADKQIVLLITSGDVRVWGSHDCAIEPGTDVVTLKPGQPVKRGIVWSGETSTPGCQGTRLVAQAGTYELTATLVKQASVAVAFRLTGGGTATGTG